MNPKDHWQRVYVAKHATQVSWYSPHLERSIAMIRSVADCSARIIDVGGGSSTLVDDLLALGYTDVAVLDVSSAALADSKTRLGARSAEVDWIVGDVTTLNLSGQAYDVWHDRVGFHFLTDPADRSAYVTLMTASVRIGGHAIFATFSLDGPDHCSGLNVVRYSAESLGRELGAAFALNEEIHETHSTPSGAEQKLMYCMFERVGRPSMPGKINVHACFEKFHDTFSPKIVGELNGQQVLLVRCEGDKVPWHTHDEEDELFYVLDGVLEVHGRESTTTLQAGEFCIVPRGTEHRIVAQGHVKLMLFEPAGIAHTGNVESEITRKQYERLES